MHYYCMPAIIKALVLLLLAVSRLDAAAASIRLFGQTITPVSSQGDSPGVDNKWPASQQQQQQQQQKLYVGSNCAINLPHGLNHAMAEKASLRKTVELLFILKCDLKPLIEILNGVINQSGRLGGSQAGGGHRIIDYTKLDAFDGSASSAEIWRQYAAFQERIDLFAERAIYLLGQRDCCTEKTIDEYRELRALAEGSRLLELAYDLLATDYHGHCLVITVKILPKVPSLVKDVTKMYIDGTKDTYRVNLNDPSRLEAEAGFDIDEAIRKQGPIESVAPLALTLRSHYDWGEFRQLFKLECKNYVMDTMDIWEPMRLMSERLATEANSIRLLNNLIMRSIIPLKYADICTQLSLKA